MKKINGMVSVLKMVVKYGAYIAVIVRVVQYAIDEFGKVDAPEADKTLDNE